MVELGKLVKGKFGGKAHYFLRLDSVQSGVEEKYFSLLRFLENRAPFGRGYCGNDGHIIKTKDVYTSGETSSYWGNVEQRKGAQIDKFQQIMSNVGQMIKALFQLLRELRILEERISFYDMSEKGGDEGNSAEIALKSVWVDQIEGGAKSAASVTGLAGTVGFAVLPDLFYSVHPRRKEDVDEAVKQLEKSHGINKKVREVLGRKLIQYLSWKEHTYKELQVGQRFKCSYLRQHYGVIKLYLNWLRPYLRNIKRLHMKEASSDKDIIAAFETSKIELEFLSVKKTYENQTPRGTVTKNFEHFFPCVRVQLNFIAIPQLAYQAEYQRGAIHRGRSEITIDGTVVTKDDLEKYQSDLDKEDIELLSEIDSSIDAMKEDLDYYLKKAGSMLEIIKESREIKDDENERPAGFFEPLKNIGDFIKEVTGVDLKSKKGKEKKIPKTEEEKAQDIAKLDAYLAYFVFKKQHGMITE